MGVPSEPISKNTNYEARTTIDFDTQISQLSFETESEDRERHEVARIFHIIAVGDALYFSDRWRTDSIALEGNKVEVINITEDIVSFMIKRHILTTRRPQVEIRYLDISGRTLKLIEHFYHNELLAGSRVWTLEK